MLNENTVLIGGSHKPLKINKEALKKIATKAGFSLAGVAGGLGAAALFMGMKPSDVGHGHASIEKPDVEIEPKEVASVNDSMSFNEAFKAARHDAGGPNGYFTWHGQVYGTIYKEEYDKLSPEEKTQLYNNTLAHAHANDTTTGSHTSHIETPVIVVHEHAPQATHVTEDMSFKDAFAIAREEVGPGGVFTWHGHTYGTYTNEEFNSMSKEQKDDYASSVNHAEVTHSNVAASDVNIVQIDGGHTTVSAQQTNHNAEVAQSNTNEQLLHDEWVDDGQGNKVHVAMFNIDGELVIKKDTDGDGKFDEIVLSTKHDTDGHVHLHNFATGEEATFNSDAEMAQSLQSNEGENSQHADNNDNHLHNSQVDDVTHDNNTVHDDTGIAHHTVYHDDVALNNDNPDFDPNAHLTSFE